MFFISSTPFSFSFWFDADMMCQVNQLYLLHRLDQLKPTRIALCNPTHSRQTGLMTAAEWQQLFEQRQLVTAAQLEEATRLWALYAGAAPLQLQAYLQQNPITVPHLKQSLLLHLTRFPDCTNGLSQPQTALLKLIQEKASPKMQLMKRFWEQYPGYGYGDLQLELALKTVKPFFVEENELLKLNKKGEQLLQGKQRFSVETHWLGGYKLAGKGAYCYSSEEKELHRI